ncbi:uncharacterized protein PGTG_07639 [Puccinia graminis f. sp. tritici CRL 75-36-700-3]|uniref:Uncharacterized protein n=1 Tax=Puccinia graminis f. sp. tritici (strain CRL 75-36-700-3 / race SCCL) TaxID=418459 RepID=E3KCV6_PUCGT|nr:uncharacterized protein PGTG_07639 [Puccinia graminis f. sp. tritici CRL 75-36-700-3]EFP82242.2 hypothetical protein PGTG_07639 [Puccinia graminis f. sp. tritici CRL 75-36-700-3]
MSFPADHQSRKPPSNSQSLPLEPEVEPTDPILQSEVQEITEEEFLTNLSKVQSLALTCSQLRLPKSIRRDVDGMVQRLKVISKDYEENKSLALHECLTVKIGSEPTINRSSTSAAPPKRKGKKKAKHPPVSITSHISTSKSRSNEDSAPSRPPDDKLDQDEEPGLSTNDTYNESSSHVGRSPNEGNDEDDDSTEANGKDDGTNPDLKNSNTSTNQVQQEPTLPSSDSPNLNADDFSIVLNESFRKTLHDTTLELQKGRVTKSKWQTGWNSIEYLLGFRLNTFTLTKTPTATFVYNKAEFNYEKWIKEIVDSSKFGDCFM